MHEELTKLIAAERKHARDLKELRDLRAKEAQYKVPDTKILNLIDKEIAQLLTMEKK